MPHCIVEYSENLNNRANELVLAVHRAALNSGLFQEEDIKTRAIAYQAYKVGVSDASFIHVSSKILFGRDTTQKLMLNTAIVESIKALDFSHCAITAEVIDIDKASYIKIPA